VDPIQLGVDQAIPCGLIVYELVSNGLKHAFPQDQRGRIQISLKRQEEDTLMLKVADNGAGFPKDKDFRHTTSLGLELVCNLVEQLNGKIEMFNDHGTEFHMAFRSLVSAETQSG
jgi:two-component sensor histidine kinase